MKYHGADTTTTWNRKVFIWLKANRMMVACSFLAAIIFTGSTQALLMIAQDANKTVSSEVVDVGYSVYRGYHNETSNLKIFKGIRYAAAPTGALRWQKPQTPKTDKTSIIPALEYAPRCPQANHGPVPEKWFFFTEQMSEDCLFLNVQSPKNAKNLPVLVWIHGGGYGAGDGRYDFSELVSTNSLSFVVVSIQYRLAAFGFLSSTEVSKFGVPNAGLYDQHFALEWVQKHITKFGGDPSRVTIAGESAGAGSVLQQALAYGGTEGNKYFTNAIAASPYLPPQLPWDGEEPTAAYNAFIKHVGCADRHKNSTVFECINSKDTYVLQNASAYVSASSRYGEWAFLPVIDGSFIRKRPSEQLLAGEVNGLRMLSGHNSDEAPAFVPQTINTTKEFDAYTHSIFPRMNNQTQLFLSQLYAIPKTVPGSLFSTLGSSGPSALNQSSVAIGQQQRANNLYAESTFVCPSYWLADAFVSNHRKAWKYQFSVPPAAHGADFNAYYDPNFAQFATGTLSPVFRAGMQLTWGRFIRGGDPTLPLSTIGNLTNSNSYGEIRGGDDISAAAKSKWSSWQHASTIMLNLNMTGGIAATRPFWVAAGKSINVTSYTEPGLRASWSIADARAWEGGRGRRCDFLARA